MINPDKINTYGVHGYVIVSSKFFMKVNRIIAKPYCFYITVLKYCLSHDACRIGEIQQPCFRCQFFHIPAYIQHYGNGPQCFHKPPCTGSFLADQTMLTWNMLVLFSDRKSVV